MTQREIGIVVSLVIGSVFVLWLRRKSVYSRFERGVLLVVFGALVLGGGVALFMAHLV